MTLATTSTMGHNVEAVEAVVDVAAVALIEAVVATLNVDVVAVGQNLVATSRV